MLNETKLLDTKLGMVTSIQYAQRFLARNHLGRCFMAVICHKISEISVKLSPRKYTN